MYRVITGIMLLILVAAGLAFAQKDEPGSRDYPGISRMPGFFITGYKDSQFEGSNFLVTQSGKEKEEQVEGHLVKIDYELTDQGASVSRLQIIRNLQNAARSIGGKVLYQQIEDPGYAETTLRLSKDGKDVWVRVGARANMYTLTIVEREIMQQEVLMDAAAMGGGLSESGRVALYGIYFDTAKADLKPESDPTLAEIAKLLKEKPSLKVYVVGHTDMVGEAAANLRLSQARAESVVRALVSKYAVPATRLTPYGGGPYSPVASNRTEEGRARNRRVELVEIAIR